MNKETLDRRVRKTRRQLRLALATLMQQKPVQKITVRELADMVDINRATFYLHYKDVFDLLHQIEDDMFQEFNRIIQEHQPRVETEGILPMLTAIFSLMEENADMAKALLSANGDLSFVNQLKDTLRRECLSYYMSAKKQIDSKHFDYSFSYMVSGCIGLFQLWLDTGMQESCEHMAKLTEQLVMHGAKLAI